ncbi:WcaF family extracellular polysaccharide biosynthesis acetyltransferase [Leeuwenhoekiella palythoae]|uniref:Colanic acid biosynthesis acetyltransferase WcaF n=1 Tax=Leeuwenhoekiella palythoae TaxID=573501 RepID=A0A1M5UD70_9FLAO|nr:WcaF family extracellular polysaccharide biosynthesis acetyltransferase [Leeuwenhoekiella palythoae]RXG27160.1 putative colanic acid biosynthesis acetyltransferase WcaF [Leeuwenhoekiella palythoae]SHH60766.1 putative colanic acid biosynthesis acetyltransferase WcaF [Leeuwenhoekiella palythoae]
MVGTRLDQFDNRNFSKKAGVVKQFIWLTCNAFILRSGWFPFMTPKIYLLKLFGAKIGNGFVIKTGVSIKFPWKLIIGNYVWLGENTWIDNLDQVTIGDHVCISQGAMLLTGNHDYTVSTFDYRNGPIILKAGVWVGAKAVVCPGVTCNSHAVLSVGSVATKDLEAYTINQGNPARPVRKRSVK